jgi:hypothetical protein
MGPFWTDEASNVSRPDRSGADQIDAEHQATDLALGFESLAARTTRRSAAIKQEKANGADVAVSVLEC